MEIKIAPCGLVCSRCDAYRATQENSPEKLEMVAASWRKLNHCDEIQAALLPCDGCMTENGRKCFYCGNLCQIRSCAIAKNVTVCSECPDYPCSIVSDFIEHSPAGQRNAMKKLLEAIVDVEKNMHSAF